MNRARLCCLVWMFVCGASSPVVAEALAVSWTRTSSDEIRLDGDIDPDSFAKFLVAAEGGFTRVVLNSPGGMEFAAMRIAQDPRYKSAEVIVAEKCLSACANYLAVLGRSLSVDCDSVIGYHGTILRRHRVLRGYGLSFLGNLNRNYKSQAVANWYKTSEQEARDLFKYRKIDIKLLFYKNSKFLKNFYEIEFDTDTGEVSQTISQNGIWMPSEAQLRAFGLKNLTYCTPTDDADLTARVARLVKDPAKMQNSVWHVGP